MRLNEAHTFLASAARTATVNSDRFRNVLFNGIHVIVDVTAYPAAASIEVHIQAQDQTSGDWYDLLVSSAITATGTTVLKVGPGITPSPNAAANDMLPENIRVRVVHTDADSITYSVGSNLMRF